VTLRKPSETDRETLDFLAAIENDRGLPLELDRLLSEGKAWMLAGRFPLAELYLGAAVQLARHRGDADLIGDASLALARTLLEQSKAREAVPVLRSMLDVPLSVEQQVLWEMDMGFLMFQFCRYELADKYFRHILDLGEDRVPELHLGGTRIQRALLLAMQGLADAAQAQLLAGQRILERTDETGGMLAIALMDEGACYLLRGDIDRAIERLERSRSIPLVARSLKLSPRIDVWLAEAALLSGDLDLARALDEEGEWAARRGGIDSLETDILIHRVVMNEDDPVTQIAELDATAQRFHIQGQLEESARLWSMAGILAGRRGLPDELYHGRVNGTVPGATAALLNANNLLLLDAGRRPRAGRLRVRWTAAGPILPPLPPNGAPGTDREVHVGELAVAVFVADAELATAIRKQLWGFGRLIPFDDWRRFQRVTPSMDVAIVVLPSLAEEEERRNLTALKSRAPFLPVVLVTRLDVNAASRIAELQVDEVVGLGFVERDLRAAAVRASSRTVLRWLAMTLSRAEGLPVKLREALVYACRTTLPVCSVAVLAKSVERHRTTLGRMWHDAVGDERLRLEDFLAWVLLLRAVGRRPRGMSWAAVASEFNVHEQTLRGTARRLVGRPLDELADATGQAWLIEQFARKMLDPLLGVHQPTSPEPRRG